MKCCIYFILLGLAVIVTFNSFGQTDTLPSRRNNKTLLLPVVIKSPETRWGIGLANSFTFKTSRSDTLLRTSGLQSLVLYTQQKQLIAGLDATVYFPGERYIYSTYVINSVVTYIVAQKRNTNPHTPCSLVASAPYVPN